MTLITVYGCEPCEDIKKYVRENNIDVEIVEIKKRNEQYIYQDFVLNEAYGFPLLWFGLDENKKPNYLAGKEGILSFLKHGYVFETEGKFCPFIKDKCMGKECAKFNILFKGLIPEGACSDYWGPVLMTELISKLKR